MRILAVDPGTTHSACVVMEDGEIVEHYKTDNDSMLENIEAEHGGAMVSEVVVVVEQIASYGMAVGAEVFKTAWWAGRFHQAAVYANCGQGGITRKTIKMHLCGSMRAKDANIRQALIDKYGGKEKAIGKKKTPGPLYGISKDVWAALAVAVTFADTRPDLSTPGGKA